MTTLLEERKTLRDVIQAIPEELYENPTWKGLWYFGRDLVLYALCVAGLIAWSSPLIVIPLWVLTSLAIAALFVTGHDAAHEALFKSKSLNSVVGRIAMLPSYHIYSAWVYGHNRVHHGFTVREGFDFVWHPYTPVQFATMSPIKRARHRFEWSFLGAGAYYMREVWFNKMINWTPSARWKQPVRRDRILLGLVLVVATLALIATGGSFWETTWLLTRVLVVPFLGFLYIIGSVVHAHHIGPTNHWLRRDEWTRYAAQMEGTTVLRAPGVLNYFLHWIMVHVPHHVDMRIPMYNLEAATAAIEKAFPDTVVDEPLRYRTFMANSRKCKLYDFDKSEWLSYEEAKSVGPKVPNVPVNLG